MAPSPSSKLGRFQLHSLYFVSLFLSTRTSSAAASCYSRNGTLITNIAYQPCSNDTTRDSACCGINHSGAGDRGTANDICEANGLCQNWEGQVGNEQPDKLWWRQGCTDPTWQSPYCLKDVCNFDLWKNDNAPIRSCANEKWCCGEKNCCNISSSLFTLAATVGPTSTSSTSTASSTATSMSHSQSTTQFNTALSNNVPLPTDTNPSSSNNSKGGLSSGAKIGIGVAVPLVVILLATIGFLLFMLKKKGKTPKTLPTELNAGPENEKRPNAVYARRGDQAPTHPAELDAHYMPVESGGYPRAELAGDEAETAVDKSDQAGGRVGGMTNTYA